MTLRLDAAGATAVHSLLLTDLCQLTMLQTCWQRGMQAPAVLEDGEELIVLASPAGKRDIEQRLARA